MDDRIFHLFADGPAPVAPYSHAVSAGDFIFVTGQLPTGADGDPVPESIEEQTHKAMANLKTVLEDCGAGLEHVVSVRIFLTKFEEEYDRMNAVYETYFPADRRPARTIGTSCEICCSEKFAAMSLSMMPGATTLAVTPREPTSTESARIAPCRPALAAA